MRDTSRFRDSLWPAPIEMVVVLAILGVLVGVMAPGIRAYIRRARTAEAVVNLDRIALGARTYFLAEHPNPSGGSPLARQFPNSVGPTPSTACAIQVGSRCAGGDPGWTSASWYALHFSMEHRHYYYYDFASAGLDTAATFTTNARGDLDGDTVITTFSRSGSVNIQNDVDVSPMTIVEENE